MRSSTNKKNTPTPSSPHGYEDYTEVHVLPKINSLEVEHDDHTQTIPSVSSVPEDPHTLSTSSQSPSPSSSLSCLSCCFKDVEDRNAFLIIVVSILNYVAIGLTIVPLKLLINQRIAGDATEPSRASSFVDTTNIFLYAVMSFICARYTSGLGDYVGRKPLLLMSSIMTIVTRIIYISAQTPAWFYVGMIAVKNHEYINIL